jgi:hypothetical protein
LGPGPSWFKSGFSCGLIVIRAIVIHGVEQECFGSVKKKIERPKKELENVRSDTLYTRPTAREELMVQLLETLAREEIMERQRSRVKWLREGDRNTSFFQAKARARSRGNKIRGLKMKLET